MNSIAFGKAKAIVPTPLGTVSVSVEGEGSVALEVEPVAIPQLPEGMIVDGVTLVRLRFDRGVTANFPMTLHVTSDREGGPESGQYLDSVYYRSAVGTLQVAVRDDEALGFKGISAEPVGYELYGFRQTVNAAPPGALLYVGLAWRSVMGGLDETDCSTWFAADLALPN